MSALCNKYKCSWFNSHTRLQMRKWKLCSIVPDCFQMLVCAVKTFHPSDRTYFVVLGVLCKWQLHHLLVEWPITFIAKSRVVRRHASAFVWWALARVIIIHDTACMTPHPVFQINGKFTILIWMTFICTCANCNRELAYSASVCRVSQCNQMALVGFWLYTNRKRKKLWGNIKYVKLTPVTVLCYP